VLFVGIVLLVASLSIHAVTARFAKDVTRDLSALASATLGVAGWIFCYAEAVRHVDSPAAGVVLLGLPSSLLALGFSRRAVRLRTLLVGASGAMALVTAVVAPLIELSTWAALACIVTGVGVATFGAARRSLFASVAGALVGVVGVCLQVSLATQASDFVRWGSLLVGGVVLIVGASLAERHKGRVSVWFRGASDSASRSTRGSSAPA
jgi:hypothetical protein